MSRAGRSAWRKAVGRWTCDCEHCVAIRRLVDGKSARLGGKTGRKVVVKQRMLVGLLDGGAGEAVGGSRWRGRSGGRSPVEGRRYNLKLDASSSSKRRLHHQYPAAEPIQPPKRLLPTAARACYCAAVACGATTIYGSGSSVALALAQPHQAGCRLLVISDQDQSLYGRRKRRSKKYKEKLV